MDPLVDGQVLASSSLDLQSGDKEALEALQNLMDTTRNIHYPTDIGRGLKYDSLVLCFVGYFENMAY